MISKQELESIAKSQAKQRAKLYDLEAKLRIKEQEHLEIKIRQIAREEAEAALSRSTQLEQRKGVNKNNEQKLQRN